MIIDAKFIIFLKLTGEEKSPSLFPEISKFIPEISGHFSNYMI